MNFSVTKENHLAVFQLRETHLDSLLAPDLKAELLILCQDDIDVLILDFTTVSFCDSTGLSAILLAERQMRQRGGVMVVDGIGKVRTLLEIAKLSDAIPVVRDLDEARAALEE
jgi:anti-sigma B factor antagonist